MILRKAYSSLATEISGQPIGPKFNGHAVQEESDRFSRNFGN